MESDELKSMWLRTEEALERGNRLSAEILRRQHVDATQRSLRPLMWGQILQVMFGVCFIALAALLWATRPASLSVILSGIIVQAYGIGCIVTAGSILSSLSRIDYAGPVVGTQTGIAKIRKAYGISVLIAGLSWWFLWIVLLILVMGLGHFDFYAVAPSWVWINIAIGVAGWFGTYWTYRYSVKSKNVRLRQFVERAAFGRSLSAAIEQMEEIRRFEGEAASAGL